MFSKFFLQSSWHSSVTKYSRSKSPLLLSHFYPMFDFFITFFILSNYRVKIMKRISLWYILDSNSLCGEPTLVLMYKLILIINKGLHWAHIDKSYEPNGREPDLLGTIHRNKGNHLLELTRKLGLIFIHSIIVKFCYERVNMILALSHLVKSFFSKCNKENKEKKIGFLFFPNLFWLSFSKLNGGGSHRVSSNRCLYYVSVRFEKLFELI